MSFFLCLVKVRLLLRGIECLELLVMDGSLIKTLLLRSQTVLGPVRAVTSHPVSVFYLAPTQTAPL